MPQNDKSLLSRLNEHEVEFVVIGGICAVLHGVSLVTYDLDVCCKFNRENLRKLESAVKDLNPVHRMTPNKLPFELTDELCDRLKNVYLTTDLGVLDCLSEVSGLGNYNQVVQNSIVQKMSFGDFKMLNLEALIKTKEAAGREKDLYAVRLLNALKPKN